MYSSAFLSRFESLSTCNVIVYARKYCFINFHSCHNDPLFFNKKWSFSFLQHYGDLMFIRTD
jgi:hypothetical protein